MDRSGRATGSSYQYSSSDRAPTGTGQGSQRLSSHDQRPYSPQKPSGTMPEQHARMSVSPAEPSLFVTTHSTHDTTNGRYLNHLIKHNEWGLLQSMLESSEARPLDTDKYNCDALFFHAVERRAPIAIILKLLNPGKINTHNAHGNGLLYLMIHNDYSYASIRTLLEMGADIFLKNTNEWNPILLAANKGHIKLLSLFEEKAKASGQSIWDVKTPYTVSRAIYSFLFQNNKFSSDQKLEKEGNLILFLAAIQAIKSNDVKSLEALIKNGVPETATSTYKQNYLHIALAHHCNETALWLIKTYPSLIFMFDYNHELPLHFAIKCESLTMTKALIPFSGRNEPNRSGQSPVKLAQISQNTKLKDLFPQRGSTQQLTVVKSSSHEHNSQLKNAAAKNDRCTIRRHFQRVSITTLGNYSHKYDHLAFMGINDDAKRLQYVFNIYPTTYKADLTMLDQLTSALWQCDDVINSGKELTSRSKLIIIGHGPKLADMQGKEFAIWLHDWLTRKNCPPSHTPRIVINGCESARPARADSYSFAEHFVAQLATLRRFPEVTATEEKNWILPDGKDLCANAQCIKLDEKISGYDYIWLVDYWQGDSEWLKQDLQELHGFTNMTEKNRRTDLIKTLHWSNRERRVVSSDKAAQSITEGLHSLIIAGDPV